MSEAQTIRHTPRPNTVESIAQDLRTLGVREGDTLLVHASLSSMGWVCGGAQAAVMALLRATGRTGTLVMPAQSGDWSDPAEWENPPVPADWLEIIYRHMPAYDKRLTPTRGMGRIAELFRTFPGTARSDHPQSSFCANGRHAEEIVKCHPLSPQFGIHSPLGKMYDLDAKVLLLGVGYDACTSFHLAETLVDGMPVKRMGAPVYEDGERVWKWFEDFAYSSDDFDRIGAAFDQTGNVAFGKVGNAACRLFRMRTGVDFARKWLTEHRFPK